VYLCKLFGIILHEKIFSSLFSELLSDTRVDLGIFIFHCAVIQNYFINFVTCIVQLWPWGAHSLGSGDSFAYPCYCGFFLATYLLFNP
jgi:hypothetical protein